MNRTLLILSLGLAVALPLASASAQDKPKKKTAVDVSKLPPAAIKQNVTYASDIKPIFDESCARCHGAEKPKGKLRLDSLEGALKGSENGKVVEPEKAPESVLLINVARIGDPDDYMPPPNNKAKIGPLTKEQVGLIRAWIEQGAK